MGSAGELAPLLVPTLLADGSVLRHIVLVLTFLHDITGELLRIKVISL